MSSGAFALMLIRFGAGCATGNDVADDRPDAAVHRDAPVQSDADSTEPPSVPSRDASGCGTGCVDVPFDTGIADAPVSDAEAPDAGTLDAGVSDATPCVPSAEICDGKDNDCDGLVDEDFLCAYGDEKGPVCKTTCGTAGWRVCDGPSCSWGSCKPFPEDCSNSIDDDCNGLVDCADPACVSSLGCKPTGVPLSIVYAGPATPGFIWLEAWWTSPGSKPKPWGKVVECADVIPGDGKLMCTIWLPAGTSPFEFQVYLPDGRFWGDTSFDTTGGKGTTIGTVSLSTPKGALPYTLVPNPSGAPYYNGRVATVP